MISNNCRQTHAIRTALILYTIGNSECDEYADSSSHGRELFHRRKQRRGIV